MERGMKEKEKKGERNDIYDPTIPRTKIGMPDGMGFNSIHHYSFQSRHH